MESISTKFEALGVCVLIPTYNNSATLGGVIKDVAEFTHHIIVVNDGSTDSSADIIATFPFVQLISYPDNVGKGWALRKGFEYAAARYDYAITIDSDGQHFAKDLPAFINKLQQQPGALIIGARNMGQASVPGKSSFGNKFSNFWFKFETGISLPDTQSGYRLYPLQLLKGTHYLTKKFEFEIEVIVRAAWRGIVVTSVPVEVYYAPKETRVSHFRPFKDFTRISILNTFLVIITVLFIKPRNFLRMCFNKKKMNDFLKEQLFQPQHSDLHKAASIAFGIFMGIIPIWGIQLGTAIFFAILFKLNKALVIVAANISIPPMIPFIIFGSYKLGAIWMGDHPGKLEFSSSLTRESIRTNLEQYIYGSISLALIAALAFGVATFGLLKLFKRKSVLAG